MAIGMNELLDFVVILALVVLVAGAVAIALDSFQDSLTTPSNTSTLGENQTHQIVDDGLSSLGNTASQLPTIGTIIGVAVLIGIVIGAFRFARA